MASWTAANPVSIGDPTKKSHADVFFDNGQFQRNATTGAILATLLASFGAGITVTSGLSTLQAGVTVTGLGTFNTGMSVVGGIASPTTNNLSLTATDAALPIIIGTGAGDDFTINSAATAGFIYEGDTGNFGFGINNPERLVHIARDGTDDSAGNFAQLAISGSTDITKALKLGYDSTNDHGFIQAVDHGAAFKNLTITALDYSFDAGFGSPALIITSTSKLATGGETAPDVDPGGLCLNQGAGDANILTLKSSDVAHGMTSLAETDTYAEFQKSGSASGGLRIYTYSLGSFSLTHKSRASAEVTSKSISSLANIMFDASLKSGTGVAGHGSNANLFVIQNNTNTKFIFDADGDSHQDVGTLWTNFDDEEDAVAVRGLMGVLEKDPAKKHLFNMLDHNAQKFHDMGVITYTPKEKSETGHDEMFLSTKGILGLYGGAIGELHGVVDLLIKKLGIDTNYSKLRKELRTSQAFLTE